MPVTIRYDATITCPSCGAPSRTSMPEDACQFFWECPSCAAVLRPKPGHCCVFCSYGDVPCPPIQRARQDGVPSGETCVRCRRP